MGLGKQEEGETNGHHQNGHVNGSHNGSHANSVINQNQTNSSMASFPFCHNCKKEQRQKPLKVLTCCHSFCGDCIKDSEVSNGKFTCPVCTETTQRPIMGVDGLCNNFLAANKIQLAKISRFCAGCKNTSETPLPLYCSSCQACLCDKCAKNDSLHHKQGHIENYAPLVYKLLSSSAPALCYIHQTVSKTYCDSCDRVLCDDCRVRNHMGDTHSIFGVADAVGMLRNKFSMMMDSMNNLQKNIEDDVSHIHEQQDLIKRQEKESLARVDDVCNRFQEAIQQYRKNTVEKIHAAVEARINELTTIAQPLNQHYTRVANTIDFLRSSADCTSPAQQLCMHNMLHSRVEMDRAFNSPLTKMRRVSMEFCVNLDNVTTHVKKGFGYLRTDGLDSVPSREPVVRTDSASDEEPGAQRYTNGATNGASYIDPFTLANHIRVLQQQQQGQFQSHQGAASGYDTTQNVLIQRPPHPQQGFQGLSHQPPFPKQGYGRASTPGFAASNGAYPKFGYPSPAEVFNRAPGATGPLQPRRGSGSSYPACSTGYSNGYSDSYPPLGAVANPLGAVASPLGNMQDLLSGLPNQPPQPPPQPQGACAAVTSAQQHLIGTHVWANGTDPPDDRFGRYGAVGQRDRNQSNGSSGSDSGLAMPSASNAGWNAEQQTPVAQIGDCFLQDPAAQQMQDNYNPSNHQRLETQQRPESGLPTHMNVQGRENGINGQSKHMPSILNRDVMLYVFRFGEYGTEISNFTEPSGVSTSVDGRIVITDANTHRLQQWRFIEHQDPMQCRMQYLGEFGTAGKEDGQLLYPNRVAVNDATNEIIITERNPTHQVQVYTKDGNFVRRFATNQLQHPRGIAVDHMGRIIIVESKVHKIWIFTEMGRLLKQFQLDGVDFPNSVCVNNEEEIFITDNSGHKVVVYSYSGMKLREIGGEGFTNFPIGVRIGPGGYLFVMDNHNNFNITVYKQSGGPPVFAFESKVKHAQVFDIAMLDRGLVVVVSKDFRVYIYKIPDVMMNQV